MFEEVFVGEHSLEHTPGRVCMFEFVGIERPLPDHGYACKEEAGGSEHHEIEGDRVGCAGRRLDWSLVSVVLHSGIPGGRWPCPRLGIPGTGMSFTHETESATYSWDGQG